MLQHRWCNQRLIRAPNRQRSDRACLRRSRKGNCPGRVHIARGHQFIEPERAHIVIHSPRKSKRVNHPRGSLRRQRNTMVGIPIGRQRELRLHRKDGQRLSWDSDLQEIEIEILSVHAVVRNADRVIARTQHAQRNPAEHVFRRNPHVDRSRGGTIHHYTDLASEVHIP